MKIPIGPLCAGLVLSVACAPPQQQAQPQASARAVAPPTTLASPPATSFGALASSKRSESVSVESLTMNGVRKSETKAPAGKTFVVLSFQGKSCRPEGMAAMTSLADGRFARTDDTTWLTDAAGAKYKPGLPASEDAACQLAFEVPAAAAGLVWHDGDRAAYQLEPSISRRAGPAGK